ncbi:phosphatase PAP2 family protein [Lentibacillus salinarum]|uniref:Phosphatase PAP2 family protein n=1 Tax=Lentibacillus salinarum TaxID=446820 RepID=A0ABW3ZT43_9BACI
MWNRRHTMLLLLVIVLSVIGIWIGRIISGRIIVVDQLTRGLVDQLADTYFYTVFRWITELGSGTFLTPFTVIVAFIVWRSFRDWLPALVFGLGTLGSHGLNVLIKHLVARERPSIFIAANAEGFSFPSGHAMIPMVCYGLLAYFLTKKITSSKSVFIIQFSLALLIFLIGISRYVINVHYLTDVLAGFVFGFLYLIGIIILYEKLQSVRRKSPT